VTEAITHTRNKGCLMKNFEMTSIRTKIRVTKVLHE